MPVNSGLFVMNPRRVHQLMLDRFPAFNTVDFDWENIHDGKAPRYKELSDFLVRCIEAPEVLVEVRRKLGAFLSTVALHHTLLLHISSQNGGQDLLRAYGVACAGLIKTDSPIGC